MSTVSHAAGKQRTYCSAAIHTAQRMRSLDLLIWTPFRKVPLRSAMFMASIAVCRVTQFKLQEYGLSRSDCPTVVIDDEVGGFGNVSPRNDR